MVVSADLKRVFLLFAGLGIFVLSACSSSEPEVTATENTGIEDTATESANPLFVTNQEEYQEAVKQLQPGDTLTLANGVWNDFEILFIGEGTAEQPITLTAETKGEVIISGQSNLRIAG